jgi:hypothetical protein
MNRQCDIHVDVFYQQDKSFSELPKSHPLYRPYNLNKRRGLPITIDYELTLVAKYREDLDQMCTNWMVHMRPDIYVKWWHPRNKTVPLESEILWGQSINMDSNTEYDPTKRFQWKATTSFTFKTWVFPGLNDVEAVKEDYRDNEDDPYGLIKYFNYYPLATYPGMGGYGFDENNGTVQYPVYGDIWERENAGFYAAETGQDFYNDGSDPEGINKGHYIINNVETSPSAVWYDEETGTLLPGQSAIKDLNLVGDPPPNLQHAGNLSVPDFKIWQDYIITDPLASPQIMFKYVYFTGGYPAEAKNASPPSGDFLFDKFTSETHKIPNAPANGYTDIIEDTPFGVSAKDSVAPEYSYDVKNKVLTIVGSNTIKTKTGKIAKTQPFYHTEIKSQISSVSGITETILIENTNKDNPMKFEIVRACDKNFELVHPDFQDNFIGINPWRMPGTDTSRDQYYQLMLELTPHTDILRELKSFTLTCWDSLSLDQIKNKNNMYRLNSSNPSWYKLKDLLQGYSFQKRLDTLTEQKTWEENGITYTLLVNDCFYFVLTDDESTDGIYDWGVVDMPKFAPYSYPVFNGTYPGGTLVYGFGCDSYLGNVV